MRRKIRQNENLFGGKANSGIIFPAILLPALILILLSGGCFLGGHNEPLPTGVEREELPDGNIKIVATARASRNAMEKGLAAMKRTTSREGAELLLKDELRSERYENANNFVRTDTVFIRGGEYCRIEGIYYPGGAPGR